MKVELVWMDKSFPAGEVVRDKIILWPHKEMPRRGDVFRLDEFLEETDYTVKDDEHGSQIVSYVAWGKDFVTINLEP